MSQYNNTNTFHPQPTNTTITSAPLTRGIRSISNCPDVIEALVQVLAHLDPVVEQYLFKQQHDDHQIKSDERSELGVAFDRVCRSVWSLDQGSSEPVDGSALGGLFPMESGISLDFVEALNIVVDACRGNFNFCKGMTSNWIRSDDCPICGCKSASERKEEFCSIKVPSNQWKEFEKSGVLNLKEVETIEGYHCDVCSFSKPAEISRSISQAPQILILQMDRFCFDYETFNVVKKNDFYKVYLNQQLKLLMENNSLESYELVAVVNHYGLQTSGSYGGFFLNPTNRRWYKVACPNQVPTLVEDFSTINNVSNYVYFFKKAAEKKSWQSTALSSQSVSDISFSFTNEEDCEM
ncbi:ubiquitin carboxyl-terminal hydrolase family protein [Naegleria gruberi]|uniref:Ubiquitin carboxyl-terminal hydrolase family protein n=1 Tax=Naegleria gruberi TaxID=5762 RepID=D2W1T8_NAEGR|nr:ubiquitin carboxyl-terminal hydrolase family protein [Naegleria gruberi]EFC36974.1 ubiquitin carboxyl-terminal hydrolase family protein [Naegleria gruberi]|eukprot:XP_002669718.1 ubiquitin carboxyl-terminal hydrolase family protein [Naegleria gruberi strain NEG-M]